MTNNHTDDERRIIDGLCGIVEDMRETEKRGLFPQQRYTAGKYADKLEELMSDG